jgi:hypothetical protein
MGGKRSQVTIFIIIAIIIVGIIILFFLLSGKNPADVIKVSMPNPQEYIEKCTKDATKQAIDIMLAQGGYINPGNYKLYENNKVAYLCYTNNYYYTCINQQPMYLPFLENEIKSYIESRIKDCFYSLKQEYQNRNYQVNEGSLNLDVQLNPKQVNVNINKRFEVSKEETNKFEKFTVKFPNPLYDLAIVAQEIANQEAKYCYFEYLGYSLLYPAISIDKKQVGSEETASKIYIIKDKITGKQLLIAIRSCAMPGGL